MKKNGLMVGIIIAVALIAGFMLLKNSSTSKKAVKKEAATAKGQKAQAPMKKPISKDRGILLVKILDHKNKEMALRVKAFRSVDSRSSSYVTSFMSNRTQELLPGTYDIEIDMMPQKVYKNIEVAAGRENLKELGNVTGSLNVKALNAQKKDANYIVRLMYPKSNFLVASTSANRPIEISAGIYDLDIETVPKQQKKDVKVEAGKETVLDLGVAAGTLIVKAIADNNKEVQYRVKIVKSASTEGSFFALSNKPIELVQGEYDIEILSSPRQSKKGLKISVGEETSVEFSVTAPAASPRAPAEAPQKAAKK